MSGVDLNTIGTHKLRSIPGGEVVELKSIWQGQDTVVIFFRRWGCMLCRLWAKELSEIAPVLRKNNIRLVGVGVENAGSNDFIEGKFFDGELYHVEDISTYQKLGFKRFNVVSVITSLFWKQSRDAIAKGKGMGIKCDLIGDGLQSGGVFLVKNDTIIRRFVQLYPADRFTNMEILHVGLTRDYKGDWGQTGGALLVRGGDVTRLFVQSGPGDHMPNLDILKHFNVESEYTEATMANKTRENVECELAQYVLVPELTRFV